MTCKPFDVVIVPFPFTDRDTSKHRPALALSSEPFSAGTGQTVLAMITSAGNPPWPFDVPIDADGCGLPAASKIRLKIFTLDNRLIHTKVGALSQRDRLVLREVFHRVFSV